MIKKFDEAERTIFGEQKTIRDRLSQFAFPFVEFQEASHSYPTLIV
jgi:hypothetical protein